MTRHMSLAEFRARDVRCKCSGCGRWMRHKPTVNTPAMRAEPPRASLCTDCLALADRGISA